jgi:hypothetical protein
VVIDLPFADETLFTVYPTIRKLAFLSTENNLWLLKITTIASPEASQILLPKVGYLEVKSAGRISALGLVLTMVRRTVFQVFTGFSPYSVAHQWRLSGSSSFSTWWRLPTLVSEKL